MSPSKPLDNYFEAYGAAAARVSDPTLLAGRNTFQASVEPLIVADVQAKLNLAAYHSLLEIGCGSAVLLRPLAALVKTAVGIDHPALLARTQQINVPPNVTLIGGKWPDVAPAQKFDRILAYSVLHYLASPQSAQEFIQACIRALRPGGIALLGDIPNQDTADRFRATATGQHVTNEYQALRQQTANDESQARDAIFSQVPATPNFLNDTFILGVVASARQAGVRSYIVPQPAALPFSHTREDIVIKKYEV